jgi:hypothetical protein
VLAEFIKDRPGDRPPLWWRFDSVEPRRCLGGDGAPLNQHALQSGIPMYWQELSESDPPLYESSAEYLRRNDLLLRGERERLTPADYRPVAIYARGDRIEVWRT